MCEFLYAKAQRTETLATLVGYIKIAVKRSPVLYRILISGGRLLYKRDGSELQKLSCEGVDLCLEGYPSSGNSFAYNIIRIINPQLKISSHFHSAANIKMALKHEVPVIVIIRDPRDAIASRVARFGYPETMAILEYIDFYKVVLANIDDLTIISFDEFIKETAKSLDKIRESTGIELPCADIKKTERRVLSEMAHWFEKHKREMGLPSLKREKRKDFYRTQLEESMYWYEAVDIYSKITFTLHKL